MTSRAIITFRNSDGSAELGSLWDIFSGSTINRDETSSAGIFRVYNNFAATADIADAKGFELKISADAQFETIAKYAKTTVYDFTQELIEGGYIEIKCSFASELGMAPPSGAVFESLTGTYSGSGFDLISASGTDNYNEYQVRFALPDTTLFPTSGSSTPSFFARWVNAGGVA